MYPLKRTPNFQRQHYLYWCNVYNLSHGLPKDLPDTTIRVRRKINNNFLIPIGTSHKTQKEQIHHHPIKI